MMIESAIFWIFAVLAVTSALTVVLHRSIIYSALFLIVVFLSIAAMFVLNNADFLAIAQTIIYAVGLTIILLFGVMFTGTGVFQDKSVPKSRLVALGVVCIMALALLITAVLQPKFISAVSPPMNVYLRNTFELYGSTRMLGEQLFTTYCLPFELASVLLLVAMIGAIVLSKRRVVTPEEEGLGQLIFPIDMNSHPSEEASQAYKTFLEYGRAAEATASDQAQHTAEKEPKEQDSATDEITGVK